MSAPYYADDLVTVLAGDCLDVLPTLPDASVDAVVCDPPYGISFMGKQWDQPNGSTRRGRANGREFAAGPVLSAMRNFQSWCEQWAAECLRVLKPGGHLLAFGGTRTYHRLACAVEDAGFEIRDSVCWHYGQGFPKSLNVSADPQFCQCARGESDCADDSVRGVPADVSRPAAHAASGEVADLFSPVQRQGAGPGVGQVRDDGADDARSLRSALRSSESGVEGRRDAQAGEGQLHGRSVRPVPTGVPSNGAGGRLHHGAPPSDGPVGGPLPAPVGSREPQGPEPVEQRAGEPGAVPVERGSQAGRGRPLCARCGKPEIPAGLGTALKPAHEPIVVGRKSLIGTVAANVLAHGTGALNIDGCRTATNDSLGGGQTSGSVKFAHEGWNRPWMDDPEVVARVAADARAAVAHAEELGRWPTNVLLDESQAAVLDAETGTLTSGTMRAGITPKGERSTYSPDAAAGYVRDWDTYGDSGGASRFFPTFHYEAKAGTAERPTADGVLHPTVKPLDLMRWLVRLVTPPGGVVLDPFLGSGTTAEACVVQGFRCIGIERETDYLPLIIARLSKPIQPDMFGASA